MNDTTAIIAAGEARAAQVDSIPGPREQLIRGVMGMDKMQVKITGKNSDGAYWLHLVGGGQNAGFNLGDPETMIDAALLKAASGQRFVSAENPPCAPADPLRAAAPDMLDACKAALGWFSGDELTVHDLCNQLRAAIAKAEGAGGMTRPHWLRLPLIAGYLVAGLLICVFGLLALEMM